MRVFLPASLHAMQSAAGHPQARHRLPQTRLLSALAALLVLGAAAGPALSAPARALRPPPLTGEVLRVVDGDSLWFKPQPTSPSGSAAPAAPGASPKSTVEIGAEMGSEPGAEPVPIEVRLADIDAPELCQPHGDLARRALADLALNQTATFYPRARDVYGRWVGRLVLTAPDPAASRQAPQGGQANLGTARPLLEKAPDPAASRQAPQGGQANLGTARPLLESSDRDVGAWLVSEGHAWSLRWRNDRGPLLKQERMAHALARGLHATPGAVQPVDFRRLHGPCGPASADASGAPNKPALAPKPGR